MSYTLEERQRVYRACRAIFSGDAALFRKPKKIKETLLHNRGPLKHVFQEFGEVKLADIVKQLLENRLFESDLRAKVEFPELFRTSPQQDAQREASEADAAKSVADCLGEIARFEEEEDIPEANDLEFLTRPLKHEVSIEETAIVPTSLKSSIPSLYPSYVPYGAQHAILTTAQIVLEECCFDFASKTIPDALKLPQGLSGVTVQSALVSTHQLRHTAVHRLRTTARGISRLLESAVGLAEALNDVARAAQLEELKSELDGKIKAMEMSKNVLEDRAAAGLEEIRRQREELDRQEKQLVLDMLTEDREYKDLVGKLLVASVKDIFEDRTDDGMGKEVEHVNGEVHVNSAKLSSADESEDDPDLSLQ
ncbi:ubiquinol-cytochrome-c reductase cytochrome c1 [Colletotrichum gloeosporioides Cg-14]|uniref:Ubiquinol-cytochrome-c reductase cytochrome c1 n=1 Tax=Colletotrichum gloeosporioides (strain Cg-14) TaxID=1237896 RepID=T0KYG8_COLGC|nr:ubiquinol-cytochrome-c reductase cytochrome c1 [Colletotrichum gloeosporioides Cg-14]